MELTHTISSIISLFKYYQDLGKQAIDQISDDGLFWQLNQESNSIAIIVNHLHGNMLSRWTDFLHTDGEKEWRNRDREFESTIKSRDELLQKYMEGWNCLFSAIEPLTDTDLRRNIYIRNEGHTVLEALHRQLGHYAYHIGQIVLLGKQYLNDEWITLSIARNKSNAYNTEKFSQEKGKRHFTEDI